jgi:hypothetical protein
MKSQYEVDIKNNFVGVKFQLTHSTIGNHLVIVFLKSIAQLIKD